MINSPNKIKKFASRLMWYISTTLLYVLMVFTPSVHAAPSAKMNTSPSAASIVSGSSQSVTIQVAAGSNQITGAQACITFDATKLKLTNIDTSTSALPSVTPSSSSDCSTGETQISRFAFNPNTGTVTPPSGTFTLAVLTFQAKQGGTTADIAFDNAKSYVKDNATTDVNGNYINILTGTTGSSFTLTNPPAAPPSSAPSSPPATTTSPSGTVTPKPDSPTPQPSATDTTHTTTPNDPVTAPTQAASSDVKVAPVSVKQTASKAAKKKSASHKMTYIISAAIIAVLVATGLLIKFIGAPKLPMFGSRNSLPKTNATPPTATTSSALSSIPDPELPAPSSIVTPTEPPNNPTEDSQLPH